MKNSKISILLLAMVMILAISAVSAADTNDTSDSVAQAVDEIQMYWLMLEIISPHFKAQSTQVRS